VESRGNAAYLRACTARHACIRPFAVGYGCKSTLAAGFTSVHCGLLSALGRLGSVAGVCDYRYILLPSVRRHVESGKAKDLGASASPDVERIVSVNPDALLVSPFSGSGTYGKLAGTGVPIIECADYMEHSPLARAEWMRFYGMLFGCSAEADSLFAVVEKNYMSFKKIASVMPRHPKLMCDLMQGAAWYVPGGRSTQVLNIFSAVTTRPAPCLCLSRRFTTVRLMPTCG